MSRRTEIEEQMAALQAELDAADDDDTELWVEHERGGRQVRTRLSGSHAKGWLADLLGPADGDDGDGVDDDGDGDDDPPARDKKPAGGGYFAKRKK